MALPGVAPVRVPSVGDCSWSVPPPSTGGRLHRNRWPACVGISGRNGSESLAALPRNTQAVTGRKLGPDQNNPRALEVCEALWHAAGGARSKGQDPLGKWPRHLREAKRNTPAARIARQAARELVAIREEICTER